MLNNYSNIRNAFDGLFRDDEVENDDSELDDDEVVGDDDEVNSDDVEECEVGDLPPVVQAGGKQLSYELLPGSQIIVSILFQ